MQLQDNFKNNFSLKGFASILIGFYFFLLAYAYKYLLDGFLIDNHPLGVISPQILEILCIVLAVIFIVFSSLAIFFRAKRKAKKEDYLLWNKQSKSALKKYFLTIIIGFGILLILKNYGYINLLTPIFLCCYATLLFLLKSKNNNKLYVLIGLAILLALYCFMIPSYWYSSLTIMAIANAAFGLVEKN